MNAFPDIVPAIIPEMKDRKILNYNWLAGFTASAKAGMFCSS